MIELLTDDCVDPHSHTHTQTPTLTLHHSILKQHHTNFSNSMQQSNYYRISANCIGSNDIESLAIHGIANGNEWCVCVVWIKWVDKWRNKSVWEWKSEWASEKESEWRNKAISKKYRAKKRRTRGSESKEQTNWIFDWRIHSSTVFVCTMFIPYGSGRPIISSAHHAEVYGVVWAQKQRKLAQWALMHGWIDIRFVPIREMLGTDKGRPLKGISNHSASACSLDVFVCERAMVRKDKIFKNASERKMKAQE